MQRPTATNLRIRSTRDAHVLFYAVARGVLPRITKRLDAKERKFVESGAVYVWEEGAPESAASSAGGGGIARWTDGLKWGPSRVRDDFLFYHEKDVEGEEIEALEDSSAAPSALGRPPTDSLYRTRPAASPDKLVKQTYSVHYSTGDSSENAPRKWHLTAYYTQATVEQLGVIDHIPNVGGFTPPDGMFRKARMSGKGRRDDSVGHAVGTPSQQRARSSSRNLRSTSASGSASSSSGTPGATSGSPRTSFPLFAPFINTPPTGNVGHSEGDTTPRFDPNRPNVMEAYQSQSNQPRSQSTERHTLPPLETTAGGQNWQLSPPTLPTRSHSRSPQTLGRYAPYPTLPPHGAPILQTQTSFYNAAEPYQTYPQPSAYHQPIPPQSQYGVLPPLSLQPLTIPELPSRTGDAPGASPSFAGSSSPPSSQPFGSASSRSSSAQGFGAPVGQYNPAQASPDFSRNSTITPYPPPGSTPSLSSFPHRHSFSDPTPSGEGISGRSGPQDFDTYSPSHSRSSSVHRSQTGYQFSPQYPGGQQQNSTWGTSAQGWTEQELQSGVDDHFDARSAAQGLASLAQYPGGAPSSFPNLGRGGSGPITRGRAPGTGTGGLGETAAPGRDPLDEKTLRTFPFP